VTIGITGQMFHQDARGNRAPPPRTPSNAGGRIDSEPRVRDEERDERSHFQHEFQHGIDPAAALGAVCSTYRSCSPFRCGVVAANAGNGAREITRA
jgi:hypothetical protein